MSSSLKPDWQADPTSPEPRTSSMTNCQTEPICSTFLKQMFAPLCSPCTLCPTQRIDSGPSNSGRLGSALAFRSPLSPSRVCVRACVVLTNPQPRACTCQESHQSALLALRSINTQVGPVSNHTTVFAPLNSTRTQVAHPTQQNGIQGTCYTSTQ